MTTPATANVVADQAFLRRAADMGSERIAGYSRAERYYDGDQGTKSTDRLKEYLEISGLPYAENFCETVVDALAERLAVAGIESENEDLAAWLQKKVWDANELDDEQVRLFGEATKLGDAFLIAEWDSARGVVRLAYNPPHVVRIEYRNGEARYAAKVWDTDEASATNPRGLPIKRMNLYWPDRVEKWFRNSADEGGDWAPHRDAADGVWPIPWVTAAGAARGIPVFHFANRPRRDQYGRSEHQATIPQQDRLNKELLDLSAVLDTMGWPQRHATGLKAGSDLKTAPGEVWIAENPDAKFGQFEAADAENILKAVGNTIERIAGRSRTPTHMLMAEQEAPSGESRKTAESGLVAKARNRAVFHGQPLVNALRMAAVIAADEAGDAEGARPPLDATAAASVTINVRWTDPETRNEKEHLETLALMHELGVSTDTILSMIPGIDAQEEQQKRAKEDADAAERMMVALDRGGSSNPADEGQGTPQPPRPGRAPVNAPAAAS